MDHCTNSFPRPGSLARLTFLLAMIALPALGVYAQTRPGADRYEKTSLATAKPCTIETSGEVTYLVKNGVELSVREDWDCDRVADAYDNCVGMPNPTQTDSDANGTGDACEALSFIWPEASAKSSSVKKTKVRTPKTPSKTRSNTKAESRKSKNSAASRSNTKAKTRTAKAADKRSRSGVKRPRKS